MKQLEQYDKGEIIRCLNPVNPSERIYMRVNAAYSKLLLAIDIDNRMHQFKHPEQLRSVGWLEKLFYVPKALKH